MSYFACFPLAQIDQEEQQQQQKKKNVFYEQI